MASKAQAILAIGGHETRSHCVGVPQVNVVTFMLVPGHIELEGNEIADALAWKELA